MTPTKAVMIKNVMALVFKTPQHQRRQFLSQLHGVVELSHVRGMGYKVSKRTWNNAMDHAKTKGVGAEVDPPKRPPSKSLAPETAKSIVDFVTKHSKHCPNRFVSVKKKQVAVMEMEGILTLFAQRFRVRSNSLANVFARDQHHRCGINVSKLYPQMVQKAETKD